VHQRLVGVAQVIGVCLQAPQLHADAVQLERQVVHLQYANRVLYRFIHSSSTKGGLGGKTTRPIV